MVLEQPWAQKGEFWAFEKAILQFFEKFWVTNLKPCSEKMNQSLQVYLNENLGKKEPSSKMVLEDSWV